MSRWCGSRSTLNNDVHVCQGEIKVSRDVVVPNACKQLIVVVEQDGVVLAEPHRANKLNGVL
jgi:hypothetical protein